MALQFIIGSAGSGKSYRLFEKMIKKSIEEPQSNIVAVVPEQFSMETQKQILTMHPRGGSFNIEVTSLVRLAYSILEEQGIIDYRVIDDLGKTLITRKVLEDCRDELVIYKNKTNMTGFTDIVKRVISEIKQYNITEETLTNMIEDSKTRLGLKHKLKDLEVINRTFNNYIQDRMITTEDVQDLFCKYIGTSETIKNTYFYFDSFTGFTPIQYRVIELLMKYAKEVVVTVTLPEDEINFKGYDRFELFSLSKETISKLRELAIMNSINIKDTIIAGKSEMSYRIRKNQPLCHIEKNIFRNGKTAPVSAGDSIEIYSAGNAQAEAEFTVKEISKLIVEKGYRYNDIAIITGDMEKYHRYLEEYLYKNNIPCFIDHKRDISLNPFVAGILAAIDVIYRDFSYDTVMHMLRLDFMDIDREDIDIFENYIRRSGRRGYRSYGKKWEKLYQGVNENQLEIINEVRKCIYENITDLRENFKKKDATVLDYTKAVYRFAVDRKIQRKIEIYRKAFEKKGDLSKAKEYGQTYENIIDLLDKIVELMSDEKMSIRDYSHILQTGFETVKVGIVPPGLDVLMVGDIERTRLKDTKKIIFFLGVNDGIIPKSGEVGGIITDTDRDFLDGKDYTLAPTARDNVFKQRVYLYSLFAKPTEKICLSYSKSDDEGKALRQSYVIGELKGLFNDLEETDIDRINIGLDDITGEEAALSYIAANMREYCEKENDDVFTTLLSIVSSDEKYRNFLNNIKDGAFYTRKNEKIKKDIAKKLYGNKENIGITRLERFAACAYKQFLTNGLKLGQRAEFELAGYDIGNLYHNSINEFFNEVERKNIEWDSLEEEKSSRMVEGIVEKVIEEYGNDVLDNTARSLFIRNQVKDTTLKTVNVLIRHIKSGKFEPKAYEMRVTHGRIDRVDTYQKGNEIYVKVIDYKSGNTTFSVKDTFLGMQMQLMVYLKDAMDVVKKENPDKNVLPAAGLYFHVADPYIERPDYGELKRKYKKNNPDTKLSDDEIISLSLEKLRDKEYKMTGLVNMDYDVINAIDENLENPSCKSDIISVETKKDGNLSSKSMVIDSKNYNKFIQHVSNMGENMKDEILDGNIDVNPIENECQRCSFSGICRFDRRLGDRFRETENIDLKYVIAELNRDEVEENE